MITSVILLGLSLFMSTAQAAWPDSSEGRVLAVDVFRRDLQTPGNILVGDERVQAYKEACKLKYYPACNYKTWTNKDGQSDMQAAGAFFGKRCKSEPLSCVVSGWSKGYVNGKPSAKAPNPKRAVQDLTYGCEKKKYGPACAHLGEMVLWGVGTKADPKRAQALFVEACKAKDPYGCYIEGDVFYHGLGVTTDYMAARDRYRKGCEYGYTQACVKMGGMYERGNGVAQDFKRAMEFFGQACTKRDNDGCFYLARMYAQGLGVENKASIAFSMYQQLCASNDQRGCYGVAALYERGLGVEQDLDVARSLYEKACSSDYAPACSQMGAMLINNTDTPDPAAGLVFVQKGCKLGDIKGCVELGGLYYEGKVIKQDYPKAKVIFEDACAERIGVGCHRLGTMYDKGLGVASEPKKAVDLYKKGCDLLYGASCGNIGMRFLNGAGGVMKNTKEAVRHLDLGCDYGDQRSCREMADFYYKGEFVDKDVKRALKLYQSSCRNNDIKSCMKAGDLIKDGVLGKPNYGEALRAYERACKLGFKDGCEAGEPIRFQGAFENIVEDALKPKSCEVFTEFGSDPSRNKQVVSVNKDKFTVSGGQFKGQTFTVNLKDTSYRTEDKGITVEYALSYWMVTSDSAKVKPLTVEHRERWIPDRMDIREFPGKEAYARDPKGKESVYYVRPEEGSFEGMLRRNQSKDCHYVNNSRELRTENCSEVQALVASRLVTECGKVK